MVSARTKSTGYLVAETRFGEQARARAESEDLVWGERVSGKGESCAHPNSRGYVPVPTSSRSTAQVSSNETILCIALENNQHQRCIATPKEAELKVFIFLSAPIGAVK